MRLAVLSDTHGFTSDVVQSLKEMPQIDYLIHLGDHYVDGIQILQETHLEGLSIKGNNDYFFEKKPMEFTTLRVGEYRIFICHGHQFGVHHGVEDLVAHGKEQGCNVCLYGHTHAFRDLLVDGVRVINPGSPVLPRYPDKHKSYVILEIGEQIELERIILE